MHMEKRPIMKLGAGMLLVASFGSSCAAGSVVSCVSPGVFFFFFLLFLPAAAPAGF